MSMDLESKLTMVSIFVLIIFTMVMACIESYQKKVRHDHCYQLSAEPDEYQSCMNDIR